MNKEIAPSKRDYNNEYQNNQERSYAYDVDWIFRQFMMDAFEAYFPDHHSQALELGSFMGDFTELIVKRFPKLTIIEASSELAKHVQQRFPDKNLKIINSTFEEAKLDAIYDVIILAHTLEHLDDPQLVIKKAAKWLAPSGRFFIAVPNANAASRQIAVKMGLISHNSAVTNGELQHGHRRTYSLDTLEAEVEKAQAGLRVIHRGGVCFKPLANFQLDLMLKNGHIDQNFMNACYKLGMVYPDLCASVFVVCELERVVDSKS